MCHRVRRCCGSVRSCTRCRSPCRSAWRAPPKRASPDRRRLEAARQHLIVRIGFRHIFKAHARDTRRSPSHLCRPGVVLLETATLDLCLQLPVFGVDAGTRGVEEPADAKKTFTRLKTQATISQSAASCQERTHLLIPSMRETSIMLKLIMVLLYMMTEWLDWMKPIPGQPPVSIKQPDTWEIWNPSTYFCI